MTISAEVRIAAQTAADPPKRGRMKRAIWRATGLLLVGIGFVGIFVPLLPTVDFLLLALPCFARSSPRLEAWLLDHPRFGPALSAWQEHRAVPRHAKIMACLGMSLSFALFLWHVRPGFAWAAGLGVFMLFWAVWIARRPEPRPDRDKPA
jgi:uncharacterized membrane protein YbaN (DUF454 family)